MTRKRPHTVHDHALLEAVAQSVAPLSKAGARKPAEKPATKSAAAPPSVRPQQSNGKASLALSPSPPVQPAKPVGPPPLAAFDRRTSQKMVRGQADIDARIDLHGLSLEMARFHLLDFLGNRRSRGARLVLVITGKGASPFSSHTLHGQVHFDTPEREGKLRRALPRWLEDAAFRQHVIGFQPAHPRHGGGGAFYVKLRKV